MKALASAILVALAVSLAAPAASAGLFDKLPARTQAQIDRGEQVVRTQDVDGSKWPAVTIYQLAAVPPEVAMAVFTDFTEQPNYLRDCCGLVSARIVDAAVGGDPRVLRVAFELSVPIFSNERYELMERLSKEEDGSYRVTWRKVGSGGHADDIVGEAYFEPHGEGTLISYYSSVKMSVFGSGVFASRSVQRTRRTLNAFIKQMHDEYAAGGRRMRNDIARLRAIFGKR